MTKGFVLLLLLITLSARVNVAFTTQQSTGEIKLEVRDPSGQAIEVSGKLQNLLTQVVFSFQTDARGKYIFSNLSYGRYRLEISKSGFATQSTVIDVQSAT